MESEWSLKLHNKKLKCTALNFRGKSLDSFGQPKRNDEWSQILPRPQSELELEWLLVLPELLSEGHSGQGLVV